MSPDPVQLKQTRRRTAWYALLLAVFVASKVDDRHEATKIRAAAMREAGEIKALIAWGLERPDSRLR